MRSHVAGSDTLERATGSRSSRESSQVAEKTPDNAPQHLPAEDPAAVCERYFAAVAKRDFEGVLRVLVPDYAQQLLTLSRAPDFDVFFSLWCDAQGRLISIISTLRQDEYTEVVVDCGDALVRLSLQMTSAKWRIDAIQELRTRRQRLSRACSLPISKAGA